MTPTNGVRNVLNELKSETRREILAQARHHTQINVQYRLGGGKHTAQGDNCLDEIGSSDCSAFVLWCLGVDKYQPGTLGMPDGMQWINTDVLWRAMPSQFFMDVASPQLLIPSDVVVFPSGETRGGNWKVGHCGIISRTNINFKDTYVIHCSKQNHVRFGSAVQETSIGIFLRNPKTRYIRLKELT